MTFGTDLSGSGVVREEIETEAKAVKSSIDQWNLFFYLNNMAMWMAQVAQAMNAQIELMNKTYGTNVASPIHYEAQHLASSQAITAFRASAASAAILGAMTASSALARDFILEEDHKKNYLKSALDFAQYAASAVFIVAATGLAGAALVKALPFIMLGLMAANVLYQLGSFCVNIYRAINADDKAKRNECLKAAAMNLVSIALNVLVFLSFIFVLKPMFAAIQSGNTAALVASFSQTKQAILTGAFFSVLAVALVRTAAEFKQDVKKAWQDPRAALKNLLATDKAICSKVAAKWNEHKFKGVAYGALALAILPARIALAVLKALVLLVMMAAKGAVKVSALAGKGLFSSTSSSASSSRSPSVSGAAASTASPSPTRS